MALRPESKGGSLSARSMAGKTKEQPQPGTNNEPADRKSFRQTHRTASVQPKSTHTEPQGEVGEGHVRQIQAGPCPTDMTICRDAQRHGGSKQPGREGDGQATVTARTAGDEGSSPAVGAVYIQPVAGGGIHRLEIPTNALETKNVFEQARKVTEY